MSLGSVHRKVLENVGGEFGKAIDSSTRRGHAWLGNCATRESAG